MAILPILLATLSSAPAVLPADLAVSQPTAVLVRGGAWTGSGVVWDVASGRVLTALHVVEEMPPSGIEVIVGDGPPMPARVIDREPLLDLALLEVVGPLGAGPPLGNVAALAPGDPIALAGCPAARCRRGAGRVIAPERRFAGARYLAVAADARPGMSGGAVLDGRGAIVGIVDLILAREPGVALAIPIERAAQRFPRS